MDLGLSGRRVLVTGASAGIGAAVALEFAREGAIVALNSRSAARLAKAKERICAAVPFAAVHGFPADLESEAGVLGLVGAVQAKLGEVEILFANCGGPPAGGIDQLKSEDYTLALDRNLLSVVHLCRAVLPAMRRQRFGRIVALTSMAVKQPVPGLLLSNTARAGVQGFLKTVAAEVAADGITVHDVLPGYTDTERLQELAAHTAKTKGTDPASVLRGYAESTPMGRIGRPEEVAALVVFLASARASYLTGTAIPVDGGVCRGLL